MHLAFTFNFTLLTFYCIAFIAMLMIPQRPHAVVPTEIRFRGIRYGPR